MKISIILLIFITFSSFTKEVKEKSIDGHDIDKYKKHLTSFFDCKKMMIHTKDMSKANVYKNCIKEQLVENGQASDYAVWLTITPDLLEMHRCSTKEESLVEVQSEFTGEHLCFILKDKRFGFAVFQDNKILKISVFN